MKEIVKSKTMIGFIIFVLGVVYINTPKLDYSDNQNELSANEKEVSSYNI